MERGPTSDRRFCILSGLSGVAGVAMLVLSFAINNGPPPDPSSEELIKFGQQNYSHILWGAWLQAVGPVLIVVFAFALVHLAGATQRLAGWMTLFGAGVLMSVSLIEITFYMGALNPEPPAMPSISLRLIYAAQHLYFMVAAPSLFLPLGVVLIRSQVLPRVFGYLALFLAASFAVLGVAFLLTMTLPGPVTAFAGVQALWWMAAAIALMVHRGKAAVPTPAPGPR
jgi:hypothetical protein